MLLLSCGNKPPKTSPVFNQDTIVIEQSESDMAVFSGHEDASKPKEKLSVPVSSSSSSRSIRFINDDNMRGFDPASEDDMDDNGMSHYMENNDEEGWNK